MTHKSILVEAESLVHGERNVDYGPPIDDFSKTAALWQVILGDKLKPGAQIVAEDIPLCMVCVKISRELHRPNRDNLVDLAGYAETLAWVRNERDASPVAPQPRAPVPEVLVVIDWKILDHKNFLVDLQIPLEHSVEDVKVGQAIRFIGASGWLEVYYISCIQHTASYSVVVRLVKEPIE